MLKKKKSIYTRLSDNIYYLSMDCMSVLTVQTVQTVQSKLYKRYFTDTYGNFDFKAVWELVLMAVLFAQMAALAWGACALLDTCYIANGGVL
tara:strand:+ start:2823 stop:3098 length:276 start_codon:yes stop_codon:yes gene_type:complete